MRFINTPILAVAVAAPILMAGLQPAHALLGSFEVADGYTGPFPRDFWSYDAGQTGALFAPAQYNTGRWKELVGNSVANSGPQYVSQHGFIGSASLPPFAMAVRSITQTPGIDYDMTIQYDVGADDTGVVPGTALQSASITFDICPGRTVVNTGGFDTVFNDVPAFSLSFGGTDAAPGATIGFTDHDPSNFNRTQLFYDDGATYISQPIAWTSKFDQITIDINFVTQTFDMLWTPDANLSTVEFDAGSLSTVIVSGAALTSSISTLDQMYFRAHTDPSSGGGVLGGLEKSYLDNFQFTVKPVPEPASVTLMMVGGLCVLSRVGRGRR